MHVDLGVDARVRVRPERPLSAPVIDELKRCFTHQNPVHMKAKKQLEGLPRKASWKVRAALHAQLKSEPQYVATWKEDASGLSLPRGGIVRAREVLEDAGCDVDSIDERTDGDPELWMPDGGYTHRLKMRDYQTLVGDAIVEWEQGLVKSPTGSGKTSAMIAAAVRVGLPTLFVVHTGALLEQWVTRLAIELNIERPAIGILGDGKKRILPITVGTQQTLCRCVPLIRDRFGFVGYDEVHLFAASTFAKLVDEMPARFRIGVSDDVTRKDRKEFLLYDLFGEQIATVKREELVARGYIFDVEVRMFPTGFDPGWWRDVPEQERPHHWGRLIETMTADASRNALIVDLTRKEAQAGERILVWAERVEHCERLHADFCAWDSRGGLILGGKKRQKELYTTLAGIADGSLRAAFATYKAAGPSLDLPYLTRGIAATPVHNNPQFVNQIRGRICRRPDGKEDAILYYPWDEKLFGLGAVEKLCRIAKDVKMLVGKEWVDARPWLKNERNERAARAMGEG